MRERARRAARDLGFRVDAATGLGDDVARRELRVLLPHLRRRAEAAARAAETAGKAAANAALAERATAVAACLVTTAFVGGAVALLRKR